MVSAVALVVPSKGAAFEKKTVKLDALRANEVLVELHATGICHTDIAVQNSKIPLNFPAVLGHEGAGVVLAVGSQVKDCQTGDHVILSYNFCGACCDCEKKQTYRCQTAAQQNFGGCRADGSSTIVGEPQPVSTCFFGQSSFCNPTGVQEASCVKVSATLPLARVCVLGCGFQTGAGSVYNVIKPLERNVKHVAIFGVGGVGCSAIMAANHLAKQSGSSAPFDIIAIDVNDSRLELARELGATHVINSRTQSLREAVMDITQDEGIDAAVDCTSLLSVITDMIDLVGRGGIAVSVGGPPPAATVSVDVFDLLIKNKTYTGCHQGSAYAKTFIPWLAELYSQGHFPLERLQKTYPAADINTACQDMLEGRVIKPILLWK